MNPKNTLSYSTNGCFTSIRSKAFFLIELTGQVSPIRGLVSKLVNYVIIYLLGGF